MLRDKKECFQKVNTLVSNSAFFDSIILDAVQETRKARGGSVLAYVTSASLLQ